jgi:poly-gamma-glutamate synthase PgsB/CapB
MSDPGGRAGAARPAKQPLSGDVLDRPALQEKPAQRTVAPFSLPMGAESMAQGGLALFAANLDLSGLWQNLRSPAENGLPELGFAVAMIGALMLLDNMRQRAQIRRNRASIPLVIGGWGTRGKSGTERLKAAMLHALDINVLVKTTGCEAMFIHGVPGRKPTEVFIHRCYDKATIWEQRDLLALAARLKVSVFLWECMALAGPMVRVLSAEWMNDDLQTLTNAYPDHEDIQGPAGHDVARSIAAFIRSRGTTITSEEQMLPILAEEARRKQARLLVLSGRESLLLGEDLLSRFPYREHPSNIALVRRLAAELGLDKDLATADMADHVVPDLGVLKIYPAVTHLGRRLRFVNGMSANERTGFLSNWQRTGCERPVDSQGQWVVTVVNNRFDRVARSKAFAEIIVRDAAAERHVLIGTNLSGLRVYIDESLTQLLLELRLFRSGDAEAQLPELVRARCQRLHYRLRIGAADAAAVLAELQGWTGGQDVSELYADVDAALAAASTLADNDETLTAIRAKLVALPFSGKLAERFPECGAELTPYVCRSIARRVLLASLERAAERAVQDPAARQAVLTRQDRLYRELFRELLLIVEDSGASGDQVINAIACACPPGIEATVMGIQNIKGTGLDFVYRFVRFDEVHALTQRLHTADAGTARNIADTLLSRSDFGMLDSALAAAAVAAAAERLAADASIASHLRNTAAHLTEIAERCQTALKAGQAQRRRLVVRIAEKGLDTLDAMRRRWRADAILDALVHHEISHERAALEMRHLVDREKKGWLRK